MVRRTTWILLFIFALLIGFAWLFQRYQSNKGDTTATATPTIPPVRLYDLTDSQVNGIIISSAKGEKIDLYRDADTSNWAIADVPVDQADSSQIESISKQLLSMQVQETLIQTPPLESIGLATPAYTITLSNSDRTQSVAYIGSQNAIGNGYYVRADNGQVVIVDKVALDDVLNLLTKPPLLPTATPEVTETASPTKPGNQGTPTP